MSDSPHRWILKALREAAEELAEQFHGLNEARLRWRPLPDEPSLKEIACHLRDYEEVSLGYLERIAYEHEPHLAAVDVDALAEERDYRAEAVGPALRRFLQARQQTSYLLWSLSADEWQRHGVHPFRGLVSIADIARDVAEHDLGHLWQMHRLRAALEARKPPSGPGG